jgi:hypothetical protein
MVLSIGMLDKALLKDRLMRLISYVAFRPGSSMQGNALRASVGSNCVVAMYLAKDKKLFIYLFMYLFIYLFICLFLSTFIAYYPRVSSKRFTFTLTQLAMLPG